MTQGEASDNAYEILIIGAGFSGIGTAIRLQHNGFDDFLLLDEADGAGGTWHWNRYPGIGVDIPSFSYQFSFEKRRNWRRTYPSGDELQSYAEHCVAKYGLRQKIRFNTRVTRAECQRSGLPESFLDHRPVQLQRILILLAYRNAVRAHRPVLETGTVAGSHLCGGSIAGQRPVFRADDPAAAPSDFLAA
jgi:hypothetical protein